MKQYLVTIVTIILISNTQCGLLDGILGVVKDTTTAIKEDVSGVVRYGKNMVLGENKPADNRNYEVAARRNSNNGLVDRLSLKIHDIAAAVRDNVRSIFAVVDNDEHGKGLLGRMFDKIRFKITKAKVFLVGGDNNQIDYSQNGFYNPSRKQTLKEKLKHYVFKNSSSNNYGIRKTLQSLKDAVERLRTNMTRYTKNETESDGAGLLDVRMATEDIAGNINHYQDNFDNRLHSTYNNVQNQVSKNRDIAKNSFDDFKRGTTNFIEDQKNNMRNNYNKLENNRNDIRNDLDDSLNKLESRFRSDLDDTKTSFTNAYSAVDKLGSNTQTDKTAK